MVKVHILQNLHNLIHNSTLAYLNGFIWQDVELTPEFKKAYSKYLAKSGSAIEFLGFTSVITTPLTKYIFVPNQWFVIASYAVDVFEELQKYKYYFRKIVEYSGNRPEYYAKKLRDEASASDMHEFMKYAGKVFSSCSDAALVEEASSQMWRFVSDYAWWSGQKTIDRGDFFYSVILNMLNLVNASQSYVAEIVCAFASDAELRNLVRDINKFAINIESFNMNKCDNIVPDYEIQEKPFKEQDSNECVTIPKPERVRIKIAGSSSLKEIKYRT